MNEQPDRDNYISALHSASVRSTTKNTDAIFTAYVIEHWTESTVCAWAPRATPASETEAEYLGESVSNFDMTTFARSRYRDFAESRGSGAQTRPWSAPASAGSAPDSACACQVWTMLRVGVSTLFRRRELKRWSFRGVGFRVMWQAVGRWQAGAGRGARRLRARNASADDDFHHG